MLIYQTVEVDLEVCVHLGCKGISVLIWRDSKGYILLYMLIYQTVEVDLKVCVHLGCKGISVLIWRDSKGYQ